MAYIKHYHTFLLFCLTISLAAMQITYAVDYTVTNTAASTPGGSRYSTEIGDDYTKQTRDSATRFIWTTFQQTNPADRKDVQQVPLFIDDHDGVAYTNTRNNEIHVSARYIQGYSAGDVKTELMGVIYHEMTHVWQWNGNTNANGGLIQGIADYVRLKAGYVPTDNHWVQPGQGDRWDQGYDVTARFLDYCNNIRNDFVAQLNMKMRDSYSDNYFVDLLGKSVDQLWADYKTSP